ncbi:MAG TPA: Sua5/YciO/YrdC/YwlC family protein [Luteimonas sp.]|nr:Sua5/YciO/YrdC/YwlC family protein [Luteimonas sp.]
MRERLTVDGAALLLRQGAVLAYPTEAVWGLGCDPFDEAAVMRVLAIKQRPVAKGLIVVAAVPAQLEHLIDWPALASDQRDTVLASWPGPHTWVVPASARAPRWITGHHDGIAVRISAHPVVSALCAAFGGALVSTSANPAGATPPQALSAMDPGLLEAVDGVVDGETAGRAAPTPIRDARSGMQLRE